jgi:hypothetical protein
MNHSDCKQSLLERPRSTKQRKFQCLPKLLAGFPDLVVEFLSASGLYWQPIWSFKLNTVKPRSILITAFTSVRGKSYGNDEIGSSIDIAHFRKFFAPLTKGEKRGGE